MVPTTVIPVKRLALSLSFALACMALGTPGAAHDRAQVEIEHLDGTGTKTIILVQPSLPGAAALIRTTPGPIPQPGEVILPPSPTPTWSARPTPKPPSY
jgi:hypothetical protein